MRGKEINQEINKPTISKLAIASLALGILGVVIVILRIQAYRPWWSEFVGRNIIGLSGIIGLILGIAALTRIHKLMAAITALIVLCSFLLFRFSGGKHDHLFLRQCSLFTSLACLVGLLISGAALQWIPSLRKKFRGSSFAILGIVVTTFLSVFWWAETCGPMSSAASFVCQLHLTEQHKAILDYADDHDGKYPDPNCWCDLLMKNTKIEDKHFFCPGVKLAWRRQMLPWPIPKRGRCYYAMNPNCDPNSPPDTVLLFDTEPGWNQHGGYEKCSLLNHFGQGCNILFNNGQVVFVKKAGLERLNWQCNVLEIEETTEEEVQQ